MQVWLFWGIIAVIAFVFEAATVSLVSVWFGIGATATAVFAAIGESAFGQSGWFFPLQVLLFIVVSALSLYLIRPLAKKMVKRAGPTNAAAIIGSKAVVTEEINNIEGKGQIKINGNIWTARSESGNVIEKEKIVIIKNISGVSAIVEVDGSVKGE